MEKATPSNQRIPLPSDLSAAGTMEDREILEPRAGALCPKCGQADLDYDGLLNLTCPNCAYTAAGCFT